ncbi:uncharacterized protein [Montipora capricornis]|uniref:uncharacterized protein n=1 Tax=Montipora capricornis TaxID=246305 RepID=UPI0035F1A817
MSPTETRYAQIEKEALALTWACKRSWEYIVGKSISGETDHKPLVPLLSTHTLDQLPPRIQRFRMRLMRFHFKEIKHIPGKKLYIADALSRLQTRIQTVKSTIDDDKMHAHIGSVISSLPASVTPLQQIMEAQEEDPVCRQIKVYCCAGWPDKYSLNDAMKPYWPSRGELSVVQNILLKASRIVIPSSMTRSTKAIKGSLSAPTITVRLNRASSTTWEKKQEGGQRTDDDEKLHHEEG